MEYSRIFPKKMLPFPSQKTVILEKDGNFLNCRILFFLFFKFFSKPTIQLRYSHGFGGNLPREPIKAWVASELASSMGYQCIDNNGITRNIQCGQIVHLNDTHTYRGLHEDSGVNFSHLQLQHICAMKFMYECKHETHNNR